MLNHTVYTRITDIVHVRLAHTGRRTAALSEATTTPPEWLQQNQHQCEHDRKKPDERTDWNASHHPRFYPPPAESQS